MDTTRHDTGTGPADALAHADSSTRLRAALAAGTRPDPALVTALVHRCRTEPDFFVRDMLTWAITRHDAERTVSRLVGELGSELPQARSQALHTLSKIGDPRAWPAITRNLLYDDDDEVALAAWRAAVALVPDGLEARLAELLAAQFSRGSRDVQLSLSRAFAGLGPAAMPVVDRATNAVDQEVRAHAVATEAIMRNPEEGFDAALAAAQRTVALRASPLIKE